MKKTIFFVLLLLFGFCCVSNGVANFDASCEKWGEDLYKIQNQLKDIREGKNISYINNHNRLEARRTDLEERISCHCKNEPFIDKYKIHISIVFSVLSIVYTVYTTYEGILKKLKPQAFQN